MNERDKDIIRLQHILEAIDAIYAFIDSQPFEDFNKDKLLQSAVIRQFEIIGEATRNISNSVKEGNSNIPWDKVTGIRNLLIHEYFRVDLMTIWESYWNDLPKLKYEIEMLLEDLQDTN